MVRAGTSPDEELAVTGAEDLQGRQRPQLLLFAAAPADRGPAHWRSPVPAGLAVLYARVKLDMPAEAFPSTLCSVEQDNHSRPSDTLLPAAELTFCNPQN